MTGELKTHDQDVADLITKGEPAADEVRQLIDRVAPALPVLMANLVSIGQVAVDYHDSIKELPQAISGNQAGLVANDDTRQAYHGQYLSFNLNINLPPPCTTGFLPAQQQRVPTDVDAPDRTVPGDLYCRVPQNSQFNVLGARNLPCETVPGKRAPTVKMCESNETYVLLNDGFNWQGDPNATLSVQAVPQLPPAHRRRTPRHRPQHQSPPYRMTQPSAHTSDPTASSTPSRISPPEQKRLHGRTCCFRSGDDLADEAPSVPAAAQTSHQQPALVWPMSISHGLESVCTTVRF